MEKVGNYLKKDLAKPGYKSKHESTKRWGWLEWRSHGLPTSNIVRKDHWSFSYQFCNIKNFVKFSQKIAKLVEFRLGKQFLSY